MNIINKAFLKLALLPSGLYGSAGIDVKQFRAILTTKLTMDDRRVSTLYQSQKKKDKPVTAATLVTMLFSAIIGIMFLLSFRFDTNMATSLTLFFTMFFVMLSATLISDFTSVLIDVRDNFIILPKPVSDRTFLAARLTHIFIHICKIIVPMSLPGLIYMIVATGFLSALVFFLTVFLVSLFSIFFINSLYILILQFTTPSRFQSIISYFQIFFAIAIYASYQVVPRMMQNMRMEEVDFNAYKGMYFFPLFWFASIWTAIFENNGTAEQVITGFAGLLLPFLSIYIVIKYLAPSFNKKLALINSSAPEERKTSESFSTKSKGGYSDFISRMLTRTAAERTAFRITWKLSSRSRDFKLKVYPGIGYMAVYAGILIWNSSADSIDSIREEGIQSRIMIISMLYFTALILTIALGQMIFSDKHKASWIYHISPIAKPGEIILGGAKAIMMKFYFPVVVVLAVAGIFLLGWKIIPQILLGMFNVLLISTMVVVMGNKVFPFSVQQNNNAKTGSFLRNIFILLFAGVVALIHFFLFNVFAVIIILSALSILATWLLTENIRNTSWEKIRSRYQDE